MEGITTCATLFFIVCFSDKVVVGSEATQEVATDECIPGCSKNEICIRGICVPLSDLQAVGKRSTVKIIRVGCNPEVEQLQKKMKEETTEVPTSTANMLLEKIQPTEDEEMKNMKAKVVNDSEMDKIEMDSEMNPAGSSISMTEPPQKSVKIEDTETNQLPIMIQPMGQEMSSKKLATELKSKVTDQSSTPKMSPASGINQPELAQNSAEMTEPQKSKVKKILIKVPEKNHLPKQMDQEISAELSKDNSETEKSTDQSSSVTIVPPEASAIGKIQPDEPAIQNFADFMNELKAYSDVTKNYFDTHELFYGLQQGKHSAVNRMKKLRETKKLLSEQNRRNFEGFERSDTVVKILKRAFPKADHKFINAFLFKYYSGDETAASKINLLISSGIVADLRKKGKEQREESKLNIKEDLKKFLKAYQKVTKNPISYKEVILSIANKSAKWTWKEVKKLEKTYDLILSMKRTGYNGLKRPGKVVKIIKKKKPYSSGRYINNFLYRYYNGDKKFIMKLGKMAK